jgi:hypothetical protein
MVLPGMESPKIADRFNPTLPPAAYSAALEALNRNSTDSKTQQPDLTLLFIRIQTSSLFCVEPSSRI